MKLTELLEEIDRLDQEASKGPWHVAPEEDEDGRKFPRAIFGPKNDLWGPQGWDNEHYIQEFPELTIPDAEFIALARTALPKLAEAVYHVLELLDAVEKSDKYAYYFSRNKSPSLVTTNEVRRAITDTLGADNEYANS